MSKGWLSKTLFQVHKVSWNKELLKQRPKRALESSGWFFSPHSRVLSWILPVWRQNWDWGMGRRKEGFLFGGINGKQGKSWGPELRIVPAICSEEKLVWVEAWQWSDNHKPVALFYTVHQLFLPWQTYFFFPVLLSKHKWKDLKGKIKLLAWRLFKMMLFHLLPSSSLPTLLFISECLFLVPVLEEPKITCQEL